MKYDLTSPCKECPFLKSNRHAYSLKRLKEFAGSAFPCHKTAMEAEDEDGFTEFVAALNSQHCAGALIFNEKRGQSNNMMRIAERLGRYDRSKLNMAAAVR